LLLGAHFKTVAAVVHYGETPQHGHYTCWIKPHENWLMISDTQINKNMKRFVNNLQDVILLFLERLPH
jgi:ubiquitin C-terminal hydrolase